MYLRMARCIQKERSSRGEITPRYRDDSLIDHQFANFFANFQRVNCDARATTIIFIWLAARACTAVITCASGSQLNNVSNGINFPLSSHLANFSRLLTGRYRFGFKKNSNFFQNFLLRTTNDTFEIQKVLEFSQWHAPLFRLPRIARTYIY